MQLQLSLLKEKAIYTTVLPEKPKGQYWITHKDSEGGEERLLSVEGVEGVWMLRSSRQADLLGNGSQRIKEVAVESMSIYNVRLRKAEETAVLLVEPVTEDRIRFHKLQLPAEGKLVIGRVAGCEIQYTNPYTSAQHAEITVSGRELVLRDCGSSNGTFVNGLRVREKRLEPGDVIFIIGLKLIVGNGFLAMNNPDGRTNVKHTVLQPYVKQRVAEVVEEQADEGDLPLYTRFYRSPRFKRDIEPAEIRIDPPPSLGNMEETPLMLMLGPSMTMGMASMFTALFAVQNALNNNGNITAAMPTLVMSGSMMTGMILWPILTRRYEGKRRVRKEKQRDEKYRSYMEEIRGRIAELSAYQSRILHENLVTVEECAARIKLVRRNLWERTGKQNDFLRVRLGLGSLPLQAALKFPEKRFTLEEDHLQEELHRLAEEPKLLENVPVPLSLREEWVCGIIGRREETIRYTRDLLFQLTALHSYDELKLVFIYDRKEQAHWEFVKWLPHVWNVEQSFRYIASQAGELKELSAHLEKEIAAREEAAAGGGKTDYQPYYVLFALDKQLASKAEMLGALLRQKENIGFSVVHVYDELKDLPKECSTVVELNGEASRVFDQNDITGAHITFTPDGPLQENALELAVRLANIRLDTASGAYRLPNMLTFLDLFQVRKIEHLNALTRWMENDPTLSLETPIGVGTTGELFSLDLHEKFHGPHGLIAGMTGSGKSEFIMTFILSLAVNYHPYEVAFILIDYKGGGMANAFAQLPHLAGTITNLDGAAVKRSLVSIQSELKRRQQIFSETSKNLQMSNLDIYKYQKLFREGRVKEPLQHLFMISDEFAELKTQQPEFMEQLVSAARIGRSLGIHLILATQKPSGVVDDQIWSNSRFRICLKVQERADSMDVIKRPDAAELSVTGRYYVQVGFNELYELGQSAWAGAPYDPSANPEDQENRSIAVMDNLGRVLKQVHGERRRGAPVNPPKQIDEINKYLAAIAREEQIRVRPLWLEPIPEVIYLEDVKAGADQSPSERRSLSPIIGLVDDPANQRQFPLVFPLSQEGNAVIYGAAGRGKTTFLTTLAYSLMEEHTPEELHLYMLDFGSETLRAFAKAPHVGDVLLSHEAEKIGNLFKLLSKEVELRKKVYSDYGGDYSSYIRAGGKAEAIVVMIHNYAAFAETYMDREEDVAYLTREGVKVGIYFVLTALNTNAVRYRLLQNFKQLYVLQMNDNSDYSAVLGGVDGVYPSKLKGRGIVKLDRVYEFQTAQLFRGLEQPLEALRKWCEAYAEQWGSKPRARRIPVLPDRVDTLVLEEEIARSKPGQLPLGIDRSSLLPAVYDWHQSYIHMVLSQNGDNTRFLQGLAEALTAKGDGGVLVVDAEGAFRPDSGKTYEYMSSKPDLEQTVVRLFQLLVSRNNSYKDALETGTSPPKYTRLYCILHSLSAIQVRLSEDAKDKLKVLLQKGELDYNVTFIVSDSVGAASSYSFESWFKTKVSPSEGIWLGGGITEQYVLKAGKLNHELLQGVGEDFGYVIQKGRTALVRLLQSSLVPASEQEVEYG